MGFYYFEQQPDALEYGLGLRPDLRARSRPRVLRAGLAYVRHRFRPDKVQLSVAAFNDRARIVYERAGFTVAGDTCANLRSWGDVEFIDMRGSVIRIAEPRCERHAAVVALETTIVAHGFRPARASRSGWRARAGFEGPVRFRRRSACSTARFGSVWRRRSSNGSRRRPARSDREIWPRASPPGRPARRRWAGRSPPRGRQASASWAQAESAGSIAAIGSTSRPISSSWLALRSSSSLPEPSRCSTSRRPRSLLETLGVPVLGWRTETLPRFYDEAGAARRCPSGLTKPRTFDDRRRALGARWRRRSARQPSASEHRRRGTDRERADGGQSWGRPVRA